MAALFREICDDLLHFSLNKYPEFATYKGLDNGREDKLDPFTLESYEQRKEFYEQLLRRLAAVDRSGLTKSDRTSADVLEHSLSTAVRGMAYKGYLMPYNHREGPDGDFIAYTLHRSKFNTEANYQTYLKRLEAFPKQIIESITLMKEGLKEGTVPHKMIQEKLSKRLKTILDTEAEALPHFKPLKTFPDVLNNEQKKEFYTKGKALIDGCIKTSIRKLLDFLEKVYFPRLRTHLSLDAPGNTPLRYQAYLSFFCDTDKAPQELHQLGRKEVAKLTEQLKQVMTKMDFKGTPNDFVNYIQGRKDLYFDNLDDVKPYCRQVVDNVIKPRLPKFFNDYHDIEYEIVEIRDRSTARGMYSAPSIDGSSPGMLTLWVSSDIARFEILPLMLHELYPGHHLQACVIQNNTDLPGFRTLKDDRRYFESPGRTPLFSAYTEGWGLYCEYLGHEMGLYEDPIDEYGYLFCNFGRAVRIVVDTGIHVYGWGEQEIREYIEEYAPIATRTIDELGRFVIWPGQASSYVCGFLKVKELRAKAEKALGEYFDIREFHAEFLDCGPVTLPVMTKIIDEYIDRVKGSTKA